MKSRIFLLSVVGVTSSLAGCSTISNIRGSDDDSLGDGENGSSDSMASGNGDVANVVESFYASLYDGNSDRANSLIHPESRMSRHSSETVERFEPLDAEIRGLEEEEISSDRVVADFTLVTTGEDGDERRSEVSIELRTSDDEWKLWESV